MKVFKTDLRKIGHTMFPKNGLLTIVCNLETANIEEILLREILLEFGNYHITDSEDFEWEMDGVENIIFYTNLPWDLYLELDI